MNKDALKDVFLHGETHADMSRFPIDSQDNIVSHDTIDTIMKTMRFSMSDFKLKSGAIYGVSCQDVRGGE